jgi:release factor glutamine methyltransferase
LPSISESIAQGALGLGGSDPENDRRAARILLSHVLGVNQEHLIARPDCQVPDAHFESYMTLVARRAAGEPLQYLTGRQEFYGLDFTVTPAVLIPRPETEIIIDRAMILAGRRAGTITIADLGTGSGCIAITLAVKLPAARIIAIDISGPALEVARANAGNHGVAGRIEFLQGDAFAALEARGGESQYDLIVANPPYVPEGDTSLLQHEVRDYEPAVALFGGKDGLDFYRRLAREGSEYLKPDGYCVLEIGYKQLDQVSKIVEGSELELVEVTSDLQGIPRTLTLGRRVL